MHLALAQPPNAGGEAVWPASGEMPRSVVVGERAEPVAMAQSAGLDGATLGFSVGYPAVERALDSSRATSTMRVEFQPVDVPPQGAMEGGAEGAVEDELPDDEEGLLFREVRGLLISTLLVDAPVGSSLTALRVHRARDRDSLTRLVWEVERSLVRARRPREAQARLIRARELLGLGNTVVHEQTLPPVGD